MVNLEGRSVTKRDDFAATRSARLHCDEALPNLHYMNGSTFFDILSRNLSDSAPDSHTKNVSRQYLLEDINLYTCKILGA